MWLEINECVKRVSHILMLVLNFAEIKIGSENKMNYSEKRADNFKKVGKLLCV